MDILRTVAELRAWRQVLARTHATLAFVPTMGNLHDGHLALVRAAQAHGPVLVSIFVNRLQFTPGEDFDRYPRTETADLQKLEQAGVAAVFLPDETVLYPQPQIQFIQAPALADELCGAFRPGHFQGVLTVVSKLFNLVQPTHALFGRKDYQQWVLIRQMVAQFNFPVEVIGLPTIRAQDGLALSSRNGYLNQQQRTEAALLPSVLQDIAHALQEGGDVRSLCAQGTKRLQQHGWQVDYLEVRQAGTLAPVTSGTEGWVVLGAARLGQTRLIDNIEVGLPAL